MDFLRQVLRGGFRLLGHVYSYKLHLKLVGFRDALYTLWIRNFLGETGAASSFHYPISLQGGGSRHIHVGARTSIESHGILGCWETFGKDQHYEPEIIIGEDCNIGEYCHITAIHRITIGNNLLTGRSILSGVNIGNNVIIAANAVVTKDIPSNSIAAGVPARVVKSEELRVKN